MARDHNYYVYILTNQIGGTLYVGITNDLRRRISEHREKIGGVFSRKYGTRRLVHFEHVFDVREAILREKQLKKWNRAWKVRLIEEQNPNWADLYPALFL